MSKPELSICIPALNARGYLNNCLNSISEFTRISYEVIVVDNGSGDGTLQMLANEFPDVHLICNQTNLGFTRPANQALQVAQGNYLLLLNPDTLLKEDTFGPIVSYMRTHAEVGLAIPKVLNEDGSLQVKCRRGEETPAEVFGYFFKLGKLFPQSKALNGYLLPWLKEDEIAEVKAISGSCMFISRSCYEKIGGFDEKIFAYQEDSDYCIRAREAGFKVLYLPLTSIVHFGGQGGSKSQPWKKIWEWHRSYVYYYRKHLAKRYFFLLNWLMYLMMAGKLGFALLKNIFVKISNEG